MEEKTEAKAPEVTEEVKTDNTDALFQSLRQELAEEEAKSRQEQESKIKDLEEKSFSKEEVKDMMKALLKEQAQAKEEIESVKSKLDDKSGSKVQTEVEDRPFKAPTKSEPEMVELTDEWVLKQKGII